MFSISRLSHFRFSAVNLFSILPRIKDGFVDKEWSKIESKVAVILSTKSFDNNVTYALMGVFR